MAKRGAAQDGGEGRRREGQLLGVGDDERRWRERGGKHSDSLDHPADRRASTATEELMGEVDLIRL